MFDLLSLKIVQHIGEYCSPDLELTAIVKSLTLDINKEQSFYCDCFSSQTLNKVFASRSDKCRYGSFYMYITATSVLKRILVPDI